MPLDLQKGPNREEHRRRQRFPANTSSYSSANSSQVIIEIPVQSEVIDMETSYIKFDMVAVDTGGNNGTLAFQDWAASSWIRDLRIYDFAGNQIGDNINHYNGIYRVLAEMKSNNESNLSYLNVLEGATLGGVTNAETSRQYCHQIRMHIFGLKDYFPANKMGGLRIEIDMEQGHQVVVSDTDEDVDYTISNVFFVCDLIKLKDEVESALDRQISSGGFEIHYESYVNRLTTIDGSSTTLNLGVLNGALKDVQAFMIQDDERTAIVDFWDNMSRNGLTSYRFKLGSQDLTESTIAVSATRAAEYLYEYLKSQKINPLVDIGDSLLTQAELLADRFVIGQRADRSNNPDELSSVRDNQQNRLELELNFTGGDSASLYTCAHLDKRLIIMGNRQFKNQ